MKSVSAIPHPTSTTLPSTPPTRGYRDYGALNRVGHMLVNSFSQQLFTSPCLAVTCLQSVFKFSHIVVLGAHAFVPSVGAGWFKRTHLPLWDLARVRKRWQRQALECVDPVERLDHNDRVPRVSTSPGCTTIALESRGHTIRLWDIRTRVLCRCET